MSTQGLRIDWQSRKVWVDGHLMPERLSKHEIAFMRYLASHRDVRCSRKETVPVVYGKVYDFSDAERLDAMVGRIRRKIGDKERPHRFLITEHKHGHLLLGYIDAEE